jgi:hypothetical protein
MGRSDAIADRLPPVYRDGPLLRQLIAVQGLQLEIHDERAREVQRSHWFDRAVDLDDAVGLAALLDVPPEPWHRRLGEYRAWVHALRDARSRFGAVTPAALQHLVETYTGGFETANRADVVRSLASWRTERNDDAPALIEWPSVRHDLRVGRVRPLHRFQLVNRGLEPTSLGILLTGLGATGPEHAPVLVNLDTGRALAYLGAVPPGQRLWISDRGEGLRAQLEHVDVTDRLRTLRLAPGVPWDLADVDAAPRALELVRGTNTLWFLPVAHFDVPGLDRVLLALADVEGAELRSVPSQARWDDARLDRDLFAQEPAVTLACTWVERTPARVDIELPAGALLHRPGADGDAIDARARLTVGLGRAVEGLRAAGVTSTVALRPFTETQRTRDRLTTVLPLTHEEVGPTGADRQPDASGVFGVTGFDDSTYR